MENVFEKYHNGRLYKSYIDLSSVFGGGVGKQRLKRLVYQYKYPPLINHNLKAINSPYYLEKIKTKNDIDYYIIVSKNIK